MNSFGIVIACYKWDIRYAKGCLASIRYFLRDVPVCFLVDGPASLCNSIKESDPHVIVLSNDSLRNHWLRKACRGWGHTKMAALWEAPFDAVLYLDADTCVWGDILSIIRDADYDLIIDRPYFASDEDIAAGLFNPQKLSVHFPEFDFAAYRNRYAINGTFFFRRGAIDLAAYQQAWTLQQDDSNLFFSGEMGIWNFLVFYGVQKEGLRVHNVHFQVLTSEEEMRLEYSPLCLTGRTPLKPAVIHFLDKPDIFTRSARGAIMNHFRLQYFLQIEGVPRWKALWQMALEDIQFIFSPNFRWAYWPRLRAAIRNLMRLMKIHACYLKLRRALRNLRIKS